MSEPPPLRIDSRGIAVPDRQTRPSAVGHPSTPPPLAVAPVWNPGPTGGQPTLSPPVGRRFRPTAPVGHVSPAGRAAVAGLAVLVVVGFVSRLSLPGSGTASDPSDSSATRSSMIAAAPGPTSNSVGAAGGPVLPKIEVGWACPAPVTAKAGTPTTVLHAYSTRGFSVFICTTPSGSVFYYGIDKVDPRRFIVLPATPDGAGYTATNGTTRYAISDTRLRVSTGTRTELDQTVIDHLP